HHLEGASLVITGEGRIDAQTLQGKLPAVVARRAKAFSPTLRVVALSGRNELTSSQSLFDDIIQTTPEGTPLSTALDPTYAFHNLLSATTHYLRRVL
ncbi:MAG: glycerate kinase, partial [Bacteroidales bacterium]|nr:glycerate kinase [Bacteroidales bacterium]